MSCRGRAKREMGPTSAAIVTAVTVATPREPAGPQSQRASSAVQPPRPRRSPLQPCDPLAGVVHLRQIVQKGRLLSPLLEADILPDPLEVPGCPRLDAGRRPSTMSQQELVESMAGPELVLHLALHAELCEL